MGFAVSSLALSPVFRLSLPFACQFHRGKCIFSAFAVRLLLYLSDPCYVAADALYLEGGGLGFFAHRQTRAEATTSLQPAHALCCARRPGQQVAGCPSFSFSTEFRESSKRGPLRCLLPSHSHKEMLQIQGLSSSHSCFSEFSSLSEMLLRHHQPSLQFLASTGAYSAAFIPALDANGAPPGPHPGGVPNPHCHECGLLSSSCPISGW